MNAYGVYNLATKTYKGWLPPSSRVRPGINLAKRDLICEAFELRVAHAEKRAESAEAWMRELERRNEAADARAEIAERQLGIEQQRVNSIEGSTSWRVTAPLRRVTGYAAPIIGRFRRLRRPPAKPSTAVAQNPPVLQETYQTDQKESEIGPHSPLSNKARTATTHHRTLLVVDHSIPKPDQDAGSRAIMDVMLCLVESGWKVYFWPQDRGDGGDYGISIKSRGISVIDHDWPGSLSDWLEAHGPLLDQILVSRATVAAEVVMTIASQCNTHLVYYGHDIGFSRLEMEAEVLKKPILHREIDVLRSLERRLWRLFDIVVYLSDEEVGIVRDLEPAVDARSIIPFSYDVFVERHAAPKSKTILFVAGFAHAPNVDAAEFLVYQVLPLIHLQCPDAKIALVGSHPSWAVSALAGDFVEVTGWVSSSDLVKWYDHSRVAVVPLRFGAGVKGKVTEALQQSLPLVVSPVGAQGIPGLDDIVPVRQTAHEIADALITLLVDDEQWINQARAQQQFAKSRYSRAAMRASVLRALQPSPGPDTLPESNRPSA